MAISIPTRKNGERILGSWFNTLRDAIIELATPTKTITANYSLTATDSILIVDSTSAAVVVTLPNPADALNKKYTIKAKSGSSIVLPFSITVTPSSGLIDDSASFTFEENYQSLSVVSDGTKWVTI